MSFKCPKIASRTNIDQNGIQSLYLELKDDNLDLFLISDNL